MLSYRLRQPNELQLYERRSAERERATGSNPGRTNTQGLLINEEKFCPVMTSANDQTARSRLSGHDDKPLVPSHNPYTYSISKFCGTLKKAHTVRTVGGLSQIQNHIILIISGHYL